MSDRLTKAEQRELVKRVEKLHTLYDLGGAYLVGPYVIDCIQGVGVWIYDRRQNGKQIFAVNNRIGSTYTDHADPVEAREVLDTLRRQMVLEDLADL